MATPTSARALDAILALQLTVAWAGEGRSTPKRLGWWETDLISEDGGGDFLARLLPRTHAWASLEAVREAARRVDAGARSKLPAPDAVRTLYFLGFELDELLDERLAFHKHAGTSAAEALPLPLALGDEFSDEALCRALHAPQADYETLSHGRRLRGAPTEPELLVQHLAAALTPFPERYPLPFFELLP